ncbi:MAG: CSLREA domain-containing protein [Caldilineaceae bacterium]|nr:CSLREA domain-containing protein [Caldilineaceae bacterium]
MQPATHLLQQLLRVLLVLTLSVAPLMSAAPAVHAEAASTFTVNSTFDAADANPGDGRCAVSTALRAVCTLRAAVQEANAHAGADTIVLAAQSYFLSINGFDLDANASTGDLDLTDPAGVIIQGNKATISANYRTFHIHATAMATLNNLTIRTAPQAIFNQGTLTFRNASITGNPRVQATQPVYAVSGIESTGALQLENVTLSGLVAGATGQIVINGVLSAPTASTLNNVTVQGGQGTAVVIGGADNVVEIVDTTLDNNPLGLFVDGVNTLTVQRSTLSHNQAGAMVIGAGGVEFPLQVNLLNSTFSGNAGGPALRLNSGDSRRVAVRLNNVTITDNNGGDLVGGIQVPAASNNLPSPLVAANSIVAGNTRNSGAISIDRDCSGPLNTLGQNMIKLDAATTCTISGPNRNELPALEALAANGGATQSHAPANGSSAIDAGDPNLPGSGAATCETTDQTGKVRPQGARCDLGAVEVPGVLGRTFIVTSIAPTSTLAVSGPISVTVRGEGFQPDSLVRRNLNQPYPTTFVSPTELIAAIPELISNGDDGLMSLSVLDATTGLSSNGVPFLLLNPQPILTTLAPQKVRTGVDTLVTLSGAQLSPFTEVLINGEARSSSFISSSELRILIPAVDVQTAGTEISVQLFTRTPGGGASANTLKLLVVDTPGVGTGSLQNIINVAQESSTTLGWVHPEDWRKLKDMSFNIIDGTSNTVVAGFGLIEEYGQKGALVVLDGDGNVTGAGFPGDNAQLATPIGILNLKNSQINAQPGTTVEVVYAMTFNPAAAGRTFRIAITANDKNGDAHGFETVGEITIPTPVYLPLIHR